MTTKSPNSRIGTPVDRAPKAPTNARSGPASQRARSWAATAAIIAIVLAVVTAALTVTHTPAQAQSAVLISNTDQTADSGGQALNSTTAKRAQAFTLSATASADGYTVTSIGIAFHTIGNTGTAGSDLTVTLNANSTGSPGTALCTFSNPSTFTASGVHTFLAPSTGTTCPLLTMNKTYFAVIERANGNTDTISLNTTGSAEDSGSATGWSIANNRHWYTTAWGSTSGESHQIEITGNEGPPNNSAAGVPTISGTLRVDETLTAITSGIQDADGLTNQTFSYRWFRFDGTDETEITGATGSTYDLTVDDAGQRIRVKVSFNDDRGFPEGPLSSVLTDPVNSPPTGAPKVAGETRVDQTLTVDTSAIEDAEGLDDVVYTYQWVHFDGTTDTDISNATNATYELTETDLGQQIKVKVTFTDDRGNPEGPISSLPTDAVAPSNLLVSNTGQTPDASLVLINTIPRQAQGFTTGMNEDGYTVDSIGLAFDLSDTATAGTDLQVTLNEKNNSNQPRDTLCTLTDPATFTDEAVNEFQAPGTCPTLTKETTYFAVIERVNISGSSTISTAKTDSAAEDTGSTANWSIADVGFVGSTTVWDQSLLGGDAFQIEVKATLYTDNNAATGAPTISGTPRVGEVLTADTSAIEDDDGLSNVSYVYQWLHVDGMDEADISDATKSTYRLTIDDVDKNIKVKVTFDDDLGNAEGPLFSVPIEAISEGITLSATSDLIPTDLASDKFRLIFITYQGHPATSTDIENYNAYVQSQANASNALAGIKTHSSSFRVLGSTADVDARDNTYTTYTDDEPGVPIYWLNGNKVADDYADLYDGSWDDEANPTLRNGNTIPPTVIWTGSSTNGTELIATGNVSRALGKSYVQTGRLNHDPGGPLETNLASDPAIEDFRYYALSPVFVVPPRVNSVALTSDPNDDSRTGDDDTYAIDDTLEATVSFNVAADITGSPELTLLFGTAEKTASCAASTNTTTMVCSYTVVLNDTAPLGVGVKVNSLTLNGGTITTTGDTTSISLAHDAVGLQSGHKVDAIRPTLVTTGSNAPKTSTNGSKIILTFSESVSSFDRSKITLLIPSTTTTLATNGGRVNGSTVELDLTTAVLVTSAAITVELAADAVEDTAGNGNLALAATSITNNVAAVPDAPTTLTAEPAPDTTPQLAFDLTWTASSSDGGSAITKHQYRQKSGSNAFSAWTDIPDSAATEANATAYTVKGLTANNPPTTFTFEVQAINANGDSGPSNQASATVDVPEPHSQR